MGTFTLKQQNWRWYRDDDSEPITPLGNENTRAGTRNNSDKIRLRVTCAETGSKAGTGCYLGMEYSTNELSWVSMGSGNAWNYADGLGTEGGGVMSFKTTDAATYGEYHESGSNTDDYASGSLTEVDFCIAPTANIVAGTLYYFRLLWNGAEMTLNSGETHPQIVTALVKIRQEDISVTEVRTPRLSFLRQHSTDSLEAEDWPTPERQLASFASVRQAIINGLLSGGSETNGWNNEVRAKIPVTDVVRTSDTVVTITLSAESGYDIAANETITATIPAEAVDWDVEIVASPTFTITAGEATLSINMSECIGSDGRMV